MCDEFKIISKLTISDCMISAVSVYTLYASSLDWEFNQSSIWSIVNLITFIIEDDVRYIRPFLQQTIHEV